MNDGLNRVILLGNLGAEPDLRYTTNGTAVLNFRLATNETFLDRNKESHERTDWHQIVVWGNRAEALSKLLAKGSTVLVEGGLRTSSFEKDGVKRSKTEVHAREICFTGGPRRTPPPRLDRLDLPEEPLGLPPPPASDVRELAEARVAAVAAAAMKAPMAAMGRTERRADPLDEMPY
jgi:single-strand DNA-binding protein